MAQKVLEKLNSIIPGNDQILLFQLGVDCPGKTKMLWVRGKDAIRCGFHRFVPVHPTHGTF